MSLSRARFLSLFAVVTIGLAMQADDDVKALPEGSAKDLIAQVCIKCHGAATFRKLRLTEDEWWGRVGAMVRRGAKADDKQQAAIAAYLAANFGRDSKVNINTAPQAELMSLLEFTAAESKEILDYRADYGPFKKWDDLLKVPSVEAAKVEAQKDKMAF